MNQVIYFTARILSYDSYFNLSKEIWMDCLKREI